MSRRTRTNFLVILFHYFEQSGNLCRRVQQVISRLDALVHDAFMADFHSKVYLHVVDVGVDAVFIRTRPCSIQGLSANREGEPCLLRGVSLLNPCNRSVVTNKVKTVVSFIGLLVFCAHDKEAYICLGFDVDLSTSLSH